MSTVIDQIYKGITDVLASGTDQIFTLMMPGTILNATDFSSSSSESHREQHSSRLADALLNVSNVEAGHNGRQLHAEYEKALSVLIPKLNPVLENLRNCLRDALLKRIHDTLPDGKPFHGTKLELFQARMKVYHAATSDWIQARADMQKTLKSKFPDNPGKCEDEFEQWFAINVQAYEDKINQALSSASQVLSPDELGLISGILGSGSLELDNAKKSLQAAGVRYPNGEIAYPVTFTPSDWPDLLDSEFRFIDLLSSPEHLTRQIALAQDELNTQLMQLDMMSSMIPRSLQSSRDGVTAAGRAYDDARKNIIKDYTDSAATAAKIYLARKDQNETDDKKAEDAKTEVTAIAKELQRGAKKATASKKDDSKKDESKDESKAREDTTPSIPDDIDKLLLAQHALDDAQAKLHSTSEAYADAALKLISEESRYHDLKPYYDKIKKATEALDDLKAQLSVAAKAGPETISGKRPADSTQRFSPFEIAFKCDAMSEHSDLVGSFSQTSWDVDFLFGSGGGGKSDAHSKFVHDAVSKDVAIEIGMWLAKVEIERPWFNPGIFASTKDMYRTSSVPISLGPLPPADFAGASETILPTFPVAFVIAKDITIKLQINDGYSQQAQEAFERHAASGGGFLCFGVSRSSAAQGEQKAFSSCVQGTSVVMRIPGAQIIGWYQQFVSKDRSQPLDEDEAKVEALIAQIRGLNLQPIGATRLLSLASGWQPRPGGPREETHL